MNLISQKYRRKIKFEFEFPSRYNGLVFCYQNCSCDREKLLKFEDEGREFAKILRSLEQFVRTVKGQNNFWQQNDFLTCSWRFLKCKKLEQLEFKLEKNIGI